MTTGRFGEQEVTPEDWAARAAESQRVFQLSVDGYVGLTLVEAEARAAEQGRHITVQDSLDKSRANLDWRRLRVVLDDEGRVQEVAKDQDVRGPSARLR